jgi:hypothetical protein
MVVTRVWFSWFEHALSVERRQRTILTFRVRMDVMYICVCPGTRTLSQGRHGRIVDCRLDICIQYIYHMYAHPSRVFACRNVLIPVLGIVISAESRFHKGLHTAAVLQLWIDSSADFSTTACISVSRTCRILISEARILVIFKEWFHGFKRLQHASDALGAAYMYSQSSL